MILDEPFLILSRNVTDHQTWASIDDENIKQRIRIFDKPEDEPVILPTDPSAEIDKITDIQFAWTEYRPGYNAPAPEEQQNTEQKRLPTKHLITIYNHLTPGETVLLMKRQGGQRYFVIDRLYHENEDDPIWFRKAAST